MNKESRNLIHDLKGELDQISTCFNCIVFDLKEGQEPALDDVADVKKSLQRFTVFFEELTTKKVKVTENDVK